MTEYERKFIVNPFLKEDCETERKRWYNLFEEPFELFQRFNFELHYLLGSIKGIEKDQSTKDALEDRLIIANYTFSDIDFLKKIANLLISCGKSDTAKTFDHVRWMREEISYAISYYREHFSAIHLNKASNPQPIGFSGILLAKRQNSFYCTYFLHNRNVADTKSPYPIKRL